MRVAKLESVEILRGLAALAVAVFHLTNGNAHFLPDGHIAKVVGSYGYLGVEVFFVVSGFIIPYSLSGIATAGRIDPLAFTMRRLARLEPPYVASIALVIVLQYASSMVPGSSASRPDGAYWAAVPYQLLYLAPWFDQPWLSPVYWTLAIEFQYYVFILAISPFLLAPSSLRRRGALAVAVALAAISDDSRLLLPYLPLFALGFVAFLRRRDAMTSIEAAIWLSVFTTMAVVKLGWLPAMAGVLAFAALFVPLHRRVAVLSWLGTISYSIYLTHVPIGGRVINLSNRFVLSETDRWLWLGGALLVAILFAALFWACIERPSQRFSQRWR